MGRKGWESEGSKKVREIRSARKGESVRGK